MKTNEFRGLKKNSGQVAIESILLMVILVGAFLGLTGKIKKDQLLAKFVAKHIKNVETMASYGTWKADGCTAPGKSLQTLGKCHPNSIARSLSSNPKP